MGLAKEMSGGKKDDGMRRGRDRQGSGLGMVTAVEVANFVYCPEAWRLEHGLGLEPGNQAALDAGTRHHTRKAVAERMAGGYIGLGRLLVVVALAALLLLWWWS
jgi:hypothetical protein